jgi:hypothetical protein
MVLLFTIALCFMVLLCACERDTGNGSTDTNPSENQNNNDQNSLQGEWTDPDSVVYGTVFNIDEMNITINKGTMIMVFDPNMYVNPPDGSEAKEIKDDTIVRFTDETEFEVRAAGGGELRKMGEGTLDDINLQDIVIAEGNWDGDEFAATKIVIIKLFG